MKRRMTALLLGLALVAALVLGGKLLFRVLVTDRVADKGGMENPYADELPAEEAAAGEEKTEIIK